MKADDIREAYLAFFEKHGHTRYPSDSLVPANDPSLMFTSAGMTQFKDMFQGSRRLATRRATTSQKCLRVGDLDRVGFTNRHGTFFEMLGNFSFGDYFKEEAIVWAWELLTKELKIPAEKLYPSVFVEDAEAVAIWRDKIGIPESKITRLGEGDNFWPANARRDGPNGPCGPCSEIYFDHGPEHACNKPGCGVGCNCDRFVEIWNLVFTQFERREGGVLASLPQKNIDTGAGLERWAAMLQSVVSNFDSDLFQPIILAACDLLHVSYRKDPKADGRLRRIADHIRAAAFCISDNVLPSNEERGYVVRRIIRKATTDGYLLKNRRPFLHQLVPVVADVMGRAYPELRERAATIAAPIKAEEEKFLETVEQGLETLRGAIDDLRRRNSDTLSGEAAFQLHDTFGFPVELTRSLLEEERLNVDLAAFQACLEKARERSREGSGMAKEIFKSGALLEMKQKFQPTLFIGFKKLKAKATILAVIRDNQFVDEARETDPVLLLCDETPFYGEGGGQVGDTGFMRGGKVVIEILDTKRDEGYFLHHAKVVKGVVRPGLSIEAVVNAERRLNIVRNHDATHLLQAALRQVLGTHVEQHGSVVAPDHLRFDFKHFQKMTAEELRQVEELVNRKILEDVPIEKFEAPIDEAKKLGATMFFGEKYGAVVRVVRTTDDFSVELCGGCHGDHTSAIGYFKIVGEESVGSGVRRIVAVTGPEAVKASMAERDVLEQLKAELRAGKAEEVLAKVRALSEEVRKLEADLGAVKKQLSTSSLDQIVASAKSVGTEKILYHIFREELKPDQVRSLMDALIKKHRISAAALCAQADGKAFGIVGIRPELTSRGLKAGDLAKVMGAAAGASGGGKEHMAQFGMSDLSKAQAAFEAMHAVVTQKLAT